MLVDQASEGDPDIAGKAYAMNVLGCILGPLLSGFILLPIMSERASLFSGFVGVASGGNYLLLHDRTIRTKDSRGLSHSMESSCCRS